MKVLLKITLFCFLVAINGLQCKKLPVLHPNNDYDPYLDGFILPVPTDVTAGYYSSRIELQWDYDSKYFAGARSGFRIYRSVSDSSGYELLIQILSTELHSVPVYGEDEEVYRYSDILSQRTENRYLYYIVFYIRLNDEIKISEPAYANGEARDKN